MSSDYVDYYHRVKEFGKKMKWDEKKVNAMLGDRVGFEREWKMVSIVRISSYLMKQIYTCFNTLFGRLY